MAWGVAPSEAQQPRGPSTARPPGQTGTGILTTRYLGDADTRMQTIRLRAANNRAKLTSSRPTMTDTGFLKAGGTTTKKARGNVRVQLEYGRWSRNSELSQSVRTQIAQRCGTVHSYVLFTGYRPQRIRGDMRNHEVLPSL